MQPAETLPPEPIAVDVRALSLTMQLDEARALLEDIEVVSPDRPLGILRLVLAHALSQVPA